MDDGVKYIVLNTTSLKDDVDEELKTFLDYVNGNDVEGDEFIEELDDAVKLCKSLGGSSLDAIEQVVASMGFSQPEADRLVTKYW